MADEHQELGPEPKAEDFDDYDKFTAAIADFAVRKAMLPPPPVETAQDKAWREATNEDGEFKSLAHMARYTGEPLEGLEGGPDPRRYGTSAQEETRYEEDLRAFKVGRSVAAALKPSPGPPPLVPYGDDPHRTEREAIKARILDYDGKAKAARERGETRECYREVDYRERIASEQKSLDKLPPEPAVIHAQEMREKLESGAVDLLFDPKLKDDSLWLDERMGHDAPVLVAEANERARTTLRLPLEDSPYGNVLPVRPENMCRVELSEDDMRRFKLPAYHSGGPQDADSVFRRSWAALHKLGFASMAKRAFEPAQEEEEEPKPREKTPDLEHMTNKQYMDFMNARDDERCGRKPFWPAKRGRT